MHEAGIRLHVERARAGDGEAFGELFRIFRADVLRLCRRLLASRPEAEDAAAEIFLRAQRGLEGYDPGRPFRSWLLAIGGHHCVDRLRRRAIEQRLFEPGDLEAGDLAAPGPSPLRRALRAEARDAVLAGLDALPDRYRAPLVLRYYAELSYAEIAEALGVASGQVGTLIFRAKRRLREELGDLGDER